MRISRDTYASVLTIVRPGHCSCAIECLRPEFCGCMAAFADVVHVEELSHRSITVIIIKLRVCK